MSKDEYSIKYTAGERQFLLYRYFLEHTCKGHAVSRQQILDYLDSYEISISPQTLYNDINVLRGRMHLDIEFDSHINKGAGGYWVSNPIFEPYELRLIVDGIQSSKFITQDKARVITDKIMTKLADVHTRSTLNRRVYVADRIRSMNDSVVKDADRLHEAISEDKKIAFRYYHYTPDKANPKRYTRDGAQNIVSPYALYWNNGNYYLYAYDGKKFRYYRVDRMERITKPLPEKRDGHKEFREKNLTSQKAKVFDMFSGKAYDVRLRFRNELADAAIDKFGKDIMMIPFDNEHFTITVPIEVSPTFYAWIATFGRRVKILGPEPVVRGMLEFIGKVLDVYKDNGEK